MHAVAVIAILVVRMMMMIAMILVVMAEGLESREVARRRSFQQKRRSQVIADYCLNSGYCVFEPSLAAYGQRTLFILGLLETSWWTSYSCELNFFRNVLRLSRYERILIWKSAFLKEFGQFRPNLHHHHQRISSRRKS